MTLIRAMTAAKRFAALERESHKSGERGEPPSHARQKKFVSAAKPQGCRPFVGDPAAQERAF